MSSMKNNKLTFEVKWEDNDLEKIDFEVVSFEGREAISEAYEFKFNLRSEHALKNTILLGRGATFAIEMTKPDLRNSKISKYHGIIFEFTSTEKIDRYYHYKVVLAPKLAKLKYSKKSDVFIDLSLADILNSVFEAQKFTEEDLEMAFDTEDKKYQASQDGYNRYNYVCQYEEANDNFINRLLQRDGVYYYFEQGDKQEKLIITDNKDKFLPRVEKLCFRFLSDQTTALDPDALNHINCKHTVVKEQVTIKNFTYEMAHLGDKGVISCSAAVCPLDSKDSLAFMGEEIIYGENFINPDNDGDGKFLANIRAQEIYCKSKVYTAKSTIVPISAGMKISIEDDKVAEFNGEYLVTEVLHSGYQEITDMDKSSNGRPFYENTLVLIPANVQFRPQRKIPWPQIHGTMNALIDGDSPTSSVQLDDFGRYKVRLPFLKQEKEDGKGSIWLRLAVPFAGNQYGFHFPLHKGTEVVLSFRGGNPDLPVIMGAVYNSEHANVVFSENAALGGVILTKAGNLFMMDDAANKEGIGFRTPNDTWNSLR